MRLILDDSINSAQNKGRRSGNGRQIGQINDKRQREKESAAVYVVTAAAERKKERERVARATTAAAAAHLKVPLLFRVTCGSGGGGGVLIRGGKERQNEFAPWTDRPTKSKSLSNCRRRLRLHGSIWTCVGNRSRSERREGGRQTFIARERADGRENITAQHVSIAAAANGKGFLLLYSRVSTERLTLRQKMLD